MQKDDFPLYYTNQKNKRTKNPNKSMHNRYIVFYLPEKETNNYQINSYYGRQVFHGTQHSFI
jgi:hypothetical protein